MCGIAGVVSWSPKYRVTRELLSAMSARIAHRGPDGEGIFLTREQEEVDENRPQAGFAFRRLAILDPDPRAMQPFTIGKQTLVFNGEIYNFRELRAELTKIQPEYAWRTTGDTEVLLLSYAVWGEKCLEKLNGMFAFAVWDEEKGELFLARDRMGQKPLYFAAIGHDSQAWNGVPADAVDGMPIDQEDPRQRQRIGRVLAGPPPLAISFASELGALSVVPWMDCSLNDHSLGQYLQRGYISGIETIYRGGQRLPASSWLRIVREQFYASTYFDPRCPVQEGSPLDPDPVAATRRLLTEAVARQLISDVPLGCFLSGGVDSSCIVLAATTHLGRGAVKTFTVGFDDARYDESIPAEQVARHLGTQHHSFRIAPNAARDLPRLAAVFGEPFADSSALPTHYLSEVTRSEVKVALSGDGGDELFGGYDRYQAMRLAKPLRAVPLPILRFVALQIGRRLRDRPPKTLSSKLGRFLATVDQSPSRRYSSYITLFDEKTIQALRAAAYEKHIDIVESYINLQLQLRRDAVRAAIAIDRSIYLPDDLLTKVDRASMLHALEVRSPFMDHELVQFAAGLTSHQLIKGGPKRMLREAFAADLPGFVFKRKKMGSAVPIGDWLRKELRPMLHDYLFAADSFARAHFNLDVVRRLVEEHESFRVDHSQRLYALLMLELWNRGNR